MQMSGDGITPRFVFEINRILKKACPVNDRIRE